MPRFSRKSKRRSGDSEGVVDHLLNGWCLTCSMHLADHSGDALKPEWERLKDVLLPDYVRKNPGERPWGWWQWDAPGRRERVDGGVHPFDNKERSLYVARIDRPDFWKKAYGLYFGFPCVHLFPFDQGMKTEWFEATWEYLVRHNLLLPEDSP